MIDSKHSIVYINPYYDCRMIIWLSMFGIPYFSIIDMYPKNIVNVRCGTSKYYDPEHDIYRSASPDWNYNE